MPTSFTITTANQDLKADAKGHAEAVFTVTNTTNRPMRGMAKARALENTKQEWLQIAGQTETDFPPGGTQQFTVSFDAGAPAGSATSEHYSFRLDVASAMRPEEDVAEGPVVKVERPGAPPPVNGKKPFPKWIFIPIGLVVLAIIGVVLWLLLKDNGPKAYALPDVANATEADARKKLETGCEAGSACVVVEVSAVPDNTVPKGNALATEPAAGTEVPIGSTVALVVSSGPEEVPVELYKLPAVANVIEATAKKTLETGCKKAESCVQVEVSRAADSKIPAGMAIRTEPEAGTDIAIGDKVTLFVSSGPNKVTIINVVGEIAETAINRLEKSCQPEPCFDVEVTRIADNKVAKDRVIRTQPGPGTVFPAGAKVMLFVSGGTDEVTIPPVRGQLLAQARTTLANACKPTPCIQVTENRMNDALLEAGKAIGTTPRSGMAVKMKSTIVLNVSLGPELRTVGTYTRITEQAARQKIAGDGFTVGSVTKKKWPVESYVAAQEPKPGIKRPRGSRINLTVYSIK